MERTLNDYLDVKDNLRSSKIRVRISFLEKLSNINYLNIINNKCGYPATIQLKTAEIYLLN